MLDPWMERLNNSISNLALTSLTSSTSSVPAAVAVATPFNSIRKKSNNSSSSSNNNSTNSPCTRAKCRVKHPGIKNIIVRIAGKK